MSDGQPADTVRRLEWLLSRATGYFGVTNYLGARFVASPGAMTTFSQALRQRGWPSSTTARPRAAAAASRAPRPTASSTTSSPPTRINGQLAALEASAQRGGKALGSGFSYPVTLRRQLPGLAV